MKDIRRSKITGRILGVALFVIALIFVSQYRFSSPTLEAVSFLIGLSVLVVVTLLLFRSKRTWLYLMLGLLFGFVHYGIVFFIGETYPHFAIVASPIALVLSLIFLVLGTIRVFRKMFEITQ